MDQAPSKLRAKARRCRQLADHVEPPEVCQRLETFARIYEERAEQFDDPRPTLVEPPHFPSPELTGGRA